jgi:hypothetical protein
MKTVGGHRKLMFSELIQILLDILCLRVRNRNRKAVEATVKFTTQTIPPILKDFAKKVTTYAYVLVNNQMKLKTSGYSIINVGIVRLIINFL